jgi:hypothetical protein
LRPIRKSLVTLASAGNLEGKEKAQAIKTSLTEVASFILKVQDTKNVQQNHLWHFASTFWPGDKIPVEKFNALSRKVLEAHLQESSSQSQGPKSAKPSQKHTLHYRDGQQNSRPRSPQRKSN